MNEITGLITARKVVHEFVTKLPFVSLDEDFNEQELCTRFIDPLLSNLFDDPKNNIYFRWTNESTLETSSKPFINTRPDMSITETVGLKWKRSLAYGEAKPAAREHGHYLVCRDLIKVAIQCKKSLVLDGVLGIIVVGRTIRFYMLVLPALSTYVMYFLDEIKVPDSIYGLRNFVTELPTILKILHAFISYLPLYTFSPVTAHTYQHRTSLINSQS